MLLLSAGLFLAVLVAGFLSAEHLLCVDGALSPAEVIVVLGGESVDRVKQAYDLFAGGAAARMIVSGSGDGTVIRQELIRLGVPETVIELEEHSRNTKENAEFTAPLLKKAGVRQVIVVTSWFHSRRALNSFRRFAPDIRFSSASAHHQEPLATEAANVFREYVKTVWYSIRYGILPWSGRTA